MNRNIVKYLTLAALPIAFMACSSGSCDNGSNGGAVSLGTLPGGGNVMVSSGDIPVNANASGSSVGTLTVNGLPSGETVTFVMSNPQANPSLVFAPKNSSNAKASKAVDNVSRCTITAQSPTCTIKEDVSAGAYNGNYVANLAYVVEPGSATGTLNPIKYTLSGGTPAPTPVPGMISMSLSAESVAVGSTITATYTLEDASGLTAPVVVTATSSAESILSAYNGNNQCSLTLANPTCTITESGISAGTAVISSAATGYTIADSNTITVNNQPAPTPVPGTITATYSAESMNVGESIVVTYTLANSQYVTTPVTVVATSSVESVLDSASPSCRVTTASPTCTVTESGISAGTATISSAATGYTIANSNTITVAAAQPPSFNSFSILGYNGTINESNITVLVPTESMSQYANMVAATFTAVGTVKINGIVQTSGVTTNDFEPNQYVTYTVTNGGITESYNVLVIPVDTGRRNPDRSWYIESSIVPTGDLQAWQAMSPRNGQNTTMDMVIYGPGTLTFNWAVSSKENYDFLYFRVNNTRESGISGVTDPLAWSSYSYTLANNESYLITFKYSRDVNTKEGMDTGWVSGVSFTPSN
ncbi:MAG: hypothetical protein EKK64_00280 [Neisseriaceae bacterium]|nr:MAG: hypothetical protein EKK64_00280 [Neisseriaceae bacterium]